MSLFPCDFEGSFLSLVLVNRTNNSIWLFFLDEARGKAILNLAL